MSEEFELLFKQLATRSLMQRTFLAALLRRLALDVPALDIAQLQEHLYGLVANLPHTPETPQASFEAAGREELEALIAMVEEILKEVRET